MSQAAPTPPALPDEPLWPVTDARPVAFLLDAASSLERRLLQDWIERARPADCDPQRVECVPIPPSRSRRRGRIDAGLESCLAAGGDTLMAPLRVSWLPPKRDGMRRVSFRDLLSFGDPRDPGRLRQRWTLRRHPDRCRIVAGEPAPVSELRQRWREAGGADAAETFGLAEFVARQAALALDRAERRMTGARYKVPRLVPEDILSRPAFRGGLARLARQLDRSPESMAKQAARYLREIAATHTPYVIDLSANLIRMLYTRGYGEALHYDPRALEGVYALAQRHPVVFLPTHKSNFDHLVLQYALYENGHPPNHTAGGINMNFFPVGPLVRRSGVFFIRRTFKDNEVYKFVLRSYVDYLVEKRFSLEWYIEGGRSRSGKLLPPRFGMLAYVVDAFRRGKSEDVFLIPVSIAYDQIHEVRDYAAEQSGGQKEPESFGWFLRFVRRISGQYGDIHLRFGEPLSLRKALGPPDPDAEPRPDERNLAIQKVAFEVAVRINRETPITPTSLMALAMLGTGDKALTLEEATLAVRNLVQYVVRRQLPTTADASRLESPESVRQTLDSLVENGVVTRFEETPETVWAISANQHLAAAYYRNTVIHFFLNGAIAELALLRAAEPDVSDASSEFWEEAMRLRDLLKFEFFFSEKEVFRAELLAELALHDADWEKRLAEGTQGIQVLLLQIRPFSSHRTLRPFVEAYGVVADVLAGFGPGEAIEEGAILGRCLALGKQYRLQQRIHSAESVSKLLFQTALNLARNRGLLDQDGPPLAERRREFARELRHVRRRVEIVDAMAKLRRADAAHRPPEEA